MNETFYQNENTVPHRMMPRPKTTDHRETFSYVWTFLPASRAKLGATLAVANFGSRTIQTNVPMTLLGSNDEHEWHEILKIDKPGIYEVPLAVRAVRPLLAECVDARVVAFLSAA